MRFAKFCVTITVGGLADVADNALLREASQASNHGVSTSEPMN